MKPLLLSILLLQVPSADQRIEYVIAQLAQNGFTRQQAESFFQDPRLKPYPPREVAPRTIDWDQIIAQLVRPASVQQGRDFLAQHGATLQRAATESGVPQQVLVAIFRMESNFGKNAGNYVVVNVFYSFLVGSEEERRWRWAAENLVSLATFCKATGSDCYQFKGSYAGAMGPAQFLPRSVELYGKDGNGDSVVNPFDMEDAIFSAAHFLVEHGWHQDHTAALGKYYGSANGYPRAILAYAEALGLQQPDSASTPRVLKMN
ncbi:MAG: lytic murein transglycosylase [Acidobacteria bacterium]|nr:lytic murein transglycosylase [Acidobacteriota bacterium]